MSYSLESAFVRAYSRAALAVQAVLDAAGNMPGFIRQLEESTRPPVRRSGFDEDAAGEVDGAEQLADKEAEEDVAEPRTAMFEPTWLGRDAEQPLAEWEQALLNKPYECIACGARYGKSGDHTCPNLHGHNPAAYAPGMHTATDRLCVYTSANGIDTAAICGVCRPVRDIVEQMIEERFGDQSERADTQDAQMWLRAGFIDETSPAASTAGDSAGEVSDVPRSPSPARSDVVAAVEAVLIAHHPIYSTANPYVWCVDQSTNHMSHAHFHDEADWRDHVADLIAEALEPHRIYVKRGPMGEPVPVELRPDMETGQDMGANIANACEWFPQHKAQK